MQSSATDPNDYIAEMPEERQAAFKKLRAVIKKNLSKGFKEGMGYGMLGYAVPRSKYPAGYHCDPTQPLPFMGIASQKNFIAVYHMGVYASPELLDIPFELIGELAAKMSADEWIALYEQKLKR